MPHNIVAHRPGFQKEYLTDVRYFLPPIAFQGREDTLPEMDVKAWINGWMSKFVEGMIQEPPTFLCHNKCLEFIYNVNCYCGLPWWLSGKEFTCNAGDTGLIPRLGRFPGKKMATNSNIVAWEIPWTEEPGGLQSMGLQRVRHD